MFQKLNSLIYAAFLCLLTGCGGSGGGPSGIENPIIVGPAPSSGTMDLIVNGVPRAQLVGSTAPEPLDPKLQAYYDRTADQVSVTRVNAFLGWNGSAYDEEIQLSYPGVTPAGTVAAGIFYRAAITNYVLDLDTQSTGTLNLTTIGAVGQNIVGAADATLCDESSLLRNILDPAYPNCGNYLGNAGQADGLNVDFTIERTADVVFTTDIKSIAFSPVSFNPMEITSVINIPHYLVKKSETAVLTITGLNSGSQYTFEQMDSPASPSLSLHEPGNASPACIPSADTILARNVCHYTVPAGQNSVELRAAWVQSNNELDEGTRIYLLMNHYFQPVDMFGSTPGYTPLPITAESLESGQSAHYLMDVTPGQAYTVAVGNVSGDVNLTVYRDEGMTDSTGITCSAGGVDTFEVCEVAASSPEQFRIYAQVSAAVASSYDFAIRTPVDAIHDATSGTYAFAPSSGTTHQVEVQNMDPLQNYFLTAPEPNATVYLFADPAMTTPLCSAGMSINQGGAHCGTGGRDKIWLRVDQGGVSGDTTFYFESEPATVFTPVDGATASFANATIASPHIVQTWTGVSNTDRLVRIDNLPTDLNGDHGTWNYIVESALEGGAVGDFYDLGLFLGLDPAFYNSSGSLVSNVVSTSGSSFPTSAGTMWIKISVRNLNFIDAQLNTNKVTLTLKVYR